MAYDIIIGRDEADKKAFGDKGTILIGKTYVKMGQFTSLSNNLFLDVARSHVILIGGKRGSGKSYFLGVIAEGIANLEKDVAKNISVLIFDTMGIFWSMKYPNKAEEDLLKEYGLSPTGLNVNVYVPKGKFKQMKEKGIPVDYNFTIKTSELSAEDWLSVFNLEILHPVGILIERVLEDLDNKEDYDIEDILKEIKKDGRSEKSVRDAAENRFLAAKSWGLFEKDGTKIKDMLKGSKVSILDISSYDDWNIRSLVVSLLCKKLFRERMLFRKFEELNDIEAGQHYFDFEEKKMEMPLVWLFLDEAHEFLPKNRKTPATDALVQLLREGRQPGISLVLATQQPGQIHMDVMTQSDIVVSFRVTAKFDVDALNVIMQTYLNSDILGYLNNLPKLKGSAIILDDNSERIYPMRVRPKMSWHGGSAPSSVRVREKEALDLKLDEYNI